MLIKKIKDRKNIASRGDADKKKIQGQGNLASGRDADKRLFFSRTGKSCFRKRC